jgi:hypothetical protein
MFASIINSRPTQFNLFNTMSKRKLNRDTSSLGDIASNITDQNMMSNVTSDVEIEVEVDVEPTTSTEKIVNLRVKPKENRAKSFVRKCPPDCKSRIQVKFFLGDFYIYIYIYI